MVTRGKPDILVDYRRSIQHVHLEAATSIIRQRQDLRSLGNLLRPSMNVIPDLPSWVPDFSTISLHTIFGSNDEPKKIAKLIESTPEVRDSSLIVSGHVVDTVLAAMTMTAYDDEHILQAILPFLMDVQPSFKLQNRYNGFPIGGGLVEKDAIVSPLSNTAAMWRTLCPPRSDSETGSFGLLQIADLTEKTFANALTYRLLINAEKLWNEARNQREERDSMDTNTGGDPSNEPSLVPSSSGQAEGPDWVDRPVENIEKPKESQGKKESVEHQGEIDEPSSLFTLDGRVVTDRSELSPIELAKACLPDWGKFNRAFSRCRTALQRQHGISREDSKERLHHNMLWFTGSYFRGADFFVTESGIFGLGYAGDVRKARS